MGIGQTGHWALSIGHWASCPKSEVEGWAVAKQGIPHHAGEPL
ncbi:hypothetical protein QUB13_03095 [Microcoleus sp. B4-D4]